MSTRKMAAGDEPFQLFLAMGNERSFKKVADHYGVDPAQVTRRAQRERWLERLQPVEQVVAQRTQDQIVESLVDMRKRHAQVARDLIERGLEALARFQISELKDAIRAVEIGVKMEREARELPSKTVSVEITHELREKLIPAQIEAPKPRVEITFPSLEDRLTPEDIAQVHREMEDSADG